MQPHSPWVSKAIEENRELHSHEKHPSHVKKDGREPVFSAYLDELRYVLDSVELLLDNIDAPSVVITADHGEAFGEYGVVGHDPGRFHPKVRKVPWVRTSATDKREYEPEMNFSLSTSVSTKDQLKALGYK
jgi:glucan phosphoethanolaminetransferase (alkaline phosphatase superfamily)